MLQSYSRKFENYILHWIVRWNSILIDENSNIFRFIDQIEIEKYESRFNDLFDGKNVFSARIVEKYLNRNTARTFAEVEEIVNAQLNLLEQKLITEEPTLAANLTMRKKKILWHIGALRKKYHRAEIEKNEIVERRIENIFTALLPQDALQERTVSIITFLNLCGLNFIDWIYEAVEADNLGHQILYL